MRRVSFLAIFSLCTGPVDRVDMSTVLPPQEQVFFLAYMYILLVGECDGKRSFSYAKAARRRQKRERPRARLEIWIEEQKISFWLYP